MTLEEGLELISNYKKGLEKFLETLPEQSGPPDIDELPSYQNELCPFSQATADQVITPELQFLATHLPADRALLQIITLRFDETKHPSLPARGPPSLS